ncbi:hypothetical protein [uncultured Draconibacterium sp.]|uniref:hypothetical protein n=1 Tax=uncultured Draconibacterium sp. TaxID=1573823 RepID=UPI0025F2AC6E|nr:hypothetical protein [uncultured Draconibacterium sp.]
MKSKKIKLLTILLFLLPLCVVLLGAGCNDDGLDTSISDDIGDLVRVFELKYGDSMEVAYKGEKVELSITDVDDSVNVDCSLTDFSNNVDGSLAVRVYSYLQINNQDKIVKIASKPCGALFYENDGHDIQDVNDLIDDLESAPANLNDSSYFVDAFTNLFGEGSLIQDTPFRIFMAKASPTNYNQPDATIDDYQFVFIVTAKN